MEKNPLHTQPYTCLNSPTMPHCLWKKSRNPYSRLAPLQAVSATAASLLQQPLASSGSSTPPGLCLCCLLHYKGSWPARSNLKHHFLTEACCPGLKQVPLSPSPPNPVIFCHTICCNCMSSISYSVSTLEGSASQGESSDPLTLIPQSPAHILTWICFLNI